MPAIVCSNLGAPTPLHFPLLNLFFIQLLKHQHHWKQATFFLSVHGCVSTSHHKKQLHHFYPCERADMAVCQHHITKNSFTTSIPVKELTWLCVNITSQKTASPLPSLWKIWQSRQFAGCWAIRFLVWAFHLCERADHSSYFAGCQVIRLLGFTLPGWVEEKAKRDRTQEQLESNVDDLQ